MISRHWQLAVSLIICTLSATDCVRAQSDSANVSEYRLEVQRITPEGNDVPAAKQIVITFNRPVVPVGKMDRSAAELPITITPPLDCGWRWINTTALACNLPYKAPLQPATNYTLDVAPGIKTEDGTTLAEAYHHHFLTERPTLTDRDFRIWKSPTLPVLRLVFNQPVTQQSVAEHVFFTVDGQQPARVKLLVSPDPEERELPVLLPIPGEKDKAVISNQPAQKSDDQTQQVSGHEARRVWLIEPPQELPPDASVVLNTEAGLQSALGPEFGVEATDVLRFNTYPAFSYLGVRCVGLDGNQVDAAPGVAPTAKCDPLQPVRLIFSAPVDRTKVPSMLKFDPPIAVPAPTVDDQADTEGKDAPAADQSAAGADTSKVGSEYRQPHEKDRTYDFLLPYPLKPAQTYRVQDGASKLTDIFGRSLGTPVTQSFEMDHRKPNYVLDYSDAVLEKNVDSEVPLYVNNLQNFNFAYRKLTPKGAEDGLNIEQKVPPVKDIQFAMPLGVRDMLKGGSGAVFGTLTTQPGVDRGRDPRLFAQVTPFQMHVKLGHFNTLAWVTDMATGQPVAGATVSLYQDAFTTLQPVAKAKATAVTDETGLATLPGTAEIDPDLALTNVYKDEDQRYFIRVDKGEDMALLPVGQGFVIDSYRSSGSEAVYPSNKERYGHMKAWGTTAQGIYRAGDLIQYKIFVRDQNNDAFILPHLNGYHLKVIDPMGKVVHEEKNITLSAFGGTSGEFTVPQQGAVGWYKFKLIAGFAKSSSSDDPNDEEAAPTDDQRNADAGTDQAATDDTSNQKSWIAMRVLVSDFAPSPFKVSNQLNGDLFRAGAQVEVSTKAELFSGGAYTDANARITAILDAADFTSSEPGLKDFSFDSYRGEENSQQIFQTQDMVNNKGELSSQFNLGSPKVVYGKLMVESAVSDDRGKFITSQAHADFVGVDRLVGLHSSDWLFNVGKPAEVQYVAVDEHGKAAKGTAVDIKIEHEVTKAARVKGAGNAYLTEYHTEWEAAGACNGTSEEAPLTCSFTPAKSGQYRTVASITDTKGNKHSTTLESFAIGKDYVMWDNSSESSLSIIPQAKDYKVGDTARFLVKNPYPGAKALITVERFGVLDHFVQTFDSSTPTIEIKVKPDYLPGFYLSVLIVSPRVEKPPGDGGVDLGKPTYRMGYLTIPVSDPYKEMAVTAKADKDVYKPRDKVTVTLHAEPRVKDRDEPIELTVVVLDESVLALLKNGTDYFDPYKGFYKLDSLDLRNYSLLTRLVGRQRFEKKGANPGGDGGSDVSMRSLFKFVGYWNAGLKPDKDGNATFSFNAPDNLTGWRILAVASTPTDRFGLGMANFKVNKPTEIRPVLPNQVVEGDMFNAGFSVMNRTGHARTIDVKIHAKGNIDASKTPADIVKSVQLDPYKRITVFMPVATVPAGLNKLLGGQVQFSVTAGDAQDKDGLLQSLAVDKRQGLEVGATYGTTTQDALDVQVAFPKNMLPNTGSVSIVASPTVIGNMLGAFRYMQFYPYFCWEQRLSKAVMAAHYKNLKPWLPANMKWDGSETLPQDTLNMAAAFQAPNGGITYFRAQDDYVDPYLSAYTALAFNWLRKDGYQIPADVENKLQDYLINLLKNDAVPDFYSKGMTSTVRAVALEALAGRGKSDLADLTRYQPHVKDMTLLGKSAFLQASLAIKGGDAFSPDVAKQILAMSNQTGGKFVISEVWDDSYSRILASPLRENCAVLDAFVAYGEKPEGLGLVGDVPFKLVRTITQDRKNRDYWQSTQENLFCANALIDFARVYEKDKPNMVVKATMDGKALGTTTFTDPRNPAVTMARPNGENDAGRKTAVQISRQGTGRLYFATRMTYALPLELSQPQNAGIEVHREYSVERNKSWQLLAAPGEIKRGDLVRVDLYLSVPAARNFVVVDDPVPGGLEPVNRDLATDSEVDAKKADFKAAGGSIWFKYNDWIDFDTSRWSFYHQELRHDSARFYSDYLPAGNYHLSYAAQAIATGAFAALPTMAQEMYDPDVYGKTEGLNLKVAEPEQK
jgi:uncharacterized protein YfaS (alpha-2-macroglobulin family)